MTAEVWEDPDKKLKVALVARFLAPGDFRGALITLLAARDEYISPCETRPHLFDTRTVVRGENYEGMKAYLSRVRKARGLCHGCKVLPECTAFLNSLNRAEPEATGVIAGRLVSHSTVGWDTIADKIREVLEREEGSP